MSWQTKRRRMQGVSMIEVMISLVIGLMVVGAVLVSYLGAGQSGRVQAAYAQMNDDAQIALIILSRDLQLAGYAQATSVNSSSATLVKTFSARPLFGCDAGFVSPSTSGDVVCNASGSSPAFEVVYEADLTNTIATSAGLPSDCLGNGLASQSFGSVNFYLVRNRYYVANSSSGRPELQCASNRAGSSGQPLVENVEAMVLWYGEANAAAPKRVARYVRASNLQDPTFAYVLSVRVCVLMRSNEPVPLDDTGQASYLDCNASVQTSSDRYLRRAYFTTVTLRNKMSM